MKKNTISPKSSLKNKNCRILLMENVWQFILPNRNIFLLAALLYYMCANSIAQNQHKIDSLENDLKKVEARKMEFGSKTTKLFDTVKVNLLYIISKEYWGNNPNKAMDYANQCLTLAQRINYPKGIANAYNAYGNINDDFGLYPTAIDYYKKSLKIREDIEDSVGIAISYNNIGCTSKNLGRSEERR